MSYRALLVGAVVTLVPWLAGAGEAGKAPDLTPAPASEVARDVQDLVFFTDARPVVIRLHVEIDGKGFQERWDSYMSRLFQFLDRDGDGALSEAEGSRATSPQQLQQQMRGQLLFNRGQQGGAANANFGEMDTDSDRKVTLDELALYYRRNGCGPLTVLPGAGPGSQDPLTDTLFKQLDANKDGRLTREEVLTAYASLRKLDQDDDELVSAQELLPNYNPFAFQQPAVRGGVMAAALPDDSPFFPIIPDGSPKRLTQRLQLAKKVLAKYDSDGNERVSKKELGVDDAAFARLDLNEDGQVDLTELLRLLNPPADLDLALRLGRRDPKLAIAEVLPRDGKPAPLAAAMKRTTTGSLMLTQGGTQVELRGTGGPGFVVAGNRQIFTQQFRAADRDKQGFLTMKEVNQPQYQILRGLFEIADRDGDGKLTEKELEAGVDLQAAAADSGTTLMISEQGRGLFEMLDSNRDGRLSRHELRNSWTTLGPFAREGVIIRDCLPRQFQVTVQMGLAFAGGRVVVYPGAGGGPVPATMTGPLWFRKMDRNGDGFVSEREFLGTREDFHRLDLNGDSDISEEEAERASKQ